MVHYQAYLLLCAFSSMVIISGHFTFYDLLTTFFVEPYCSLNVFSQPLIEAPLLMILFMTLKVPGKFILENDFLFFRSF